MIDMVAFESAMNEIAEVRTSYMNKAVDAIVDGKNSQFIKDLRNTSDKGVKQIIERYGNDNGDRE